MDLKTVWKEVERKDFRFYCAGCKKERRIFAPPKVGTLRHIFQVLIATSFFTLITWPLFTWKGVVSFIPFWVVFETLFRLKIRDALVCHNCGFDPILCLVDSKKAVQAVDRHWRKKYEEQGVPYPEKKRKPGPKRFSLDEIEPRT